MHTVKPCGKVFDKHVYVHKNYAHLIPHKIDMDIVKELAKELPQDFKFNLIRYFRTNNPDGFKQVTFINAIGFDSMREPILGDSYYVEKLLNYRTNVMDLTVKLVKMKKNPQIYHHKWVFVPQDYPGFDWKEAKEWSEKWKSVMNTRGTTGPYSRKYNFTKIGYKDYWEWFLKDAKLVA